MKRKRDPPQNDQSTLISSPNKKEKTEFSEDPEVQKVSKAIKQKEDWKRKIQKEEILRKWKLEAVAQGLEDSKVERIFANLLFEAINDGLQSKISSIGGLKKEYPLTEEEEDQSDNARDYTSAYPDPSKYPRDDIIFKDDIIPEDLRKLLEQQLDQLAQQEPHDYHPGSDQKVLNLFHPSLYPYIRGLSYEPNATTKKRFIPRVLPENHPATEKGQYDTWDDENKLTQYACDRCSCDITGNAYLCQVCTDFSLCEECSGQTFSNHTADHPMVSVFTDNFEVGGEDDDDNIDEELEDLGYSSDIKKEDQIAGKNEHFADVFNSPYQWLPAEYKVSQFGTKVDIESYINGLDMKKYSHIYKTLAQTFQYFLPFFQKVLNRKDSNYLDLSTTRNLQVITKAANYILKPGQEYNGSWHKEGLPQENVIASGIYYYSIDESLKPDANLVFRDRKEDVLAERGEAGQDSPFYRNLGYVPTTQGRGLVFENYDLQHKVRNMKNSSSSTGTRKILCFFLVDPNNRIISSSEIPEQRWDKIKVGVAISLILVNRKMGEGKREEGLLPVELLVEILKRSKWGFRKEEAEDHRKKLMHERKYFVDINNRVWERRYSFCEH